MKHIHAACPLICILSVLPAAFSCDALDRFTETKPDIALTVPTTLQDLERLIHNEDLFNYVSDPSMGEVSSDDYFLPDDVYDGLSVMTRNTYAYQPDIYGGQATYSDWNTPYKQIYYANAVLDGLNGLSPPASPSAYSRIKGSALFFRALNHYNLLQTFAMPYDERSAAASPGIILRLSADMNIRGVRSDIATGYARVLSDLNEALGLLPVFPQYKTQPSQWACYALLARICLAMNHYADALAAAQRCLDLNPSLSDYQQLTPRTSSINAALPDEVIFHKTMMGSNALSRTRAVVNAELYSSYDENDLRKSHFFAASGGQIRFRGTYDPGGDKFCGLATDEVYLIHAECNARLGHADAALQTLEILLRTRWKTAGQPILPDVSGGSDVLQLILTERRKELLFRGLRWTDIRRLNAEGVFPVTLSRLIHNSVYALPPNDLRYALPIPPVEVELSGIAQNIRQ